MAIDVSKLGQREKLLWASFRLESPPSPSNSKFILESYARFCQAKREDYARRQRQEEYQQAHKYETRAGTKVVPADNSRGTF
jgi:hypothetical protein